MAANANLDFASNTLCDLIAEQEPPRLQAVLRMVEHLIKVINTRLGDETLSGPRVNDMLAIAKALAQQMSNQNADVRKTVVFCLVEICQSIGMEKF